MVTEQELKKRLEQEILARQRGEEGTKPVGGWIAEVQKAQQGKPSAFTTTPSPITPTEVEVKAQLQKEIEIRQAGGEGTKPEEGFISYVQKVEAQRQQEQIQKQIIEQQIIKPQLVGAIIPPQQLTQSQINAQRWKEAMLPTDKTKYNLPSLKFDVSKRYPKTLSEEIKILTKLKEQLRKGGMPGKVVGEAIPTTTGGVLLTGALPVAAVFGGPIVAGAIGLGIGVLGTKTALTKELPTETRIAGGIGGALGFLGASTIIKPYVKGQLVKLSPKYKPVKTQPEGYQAITKVPEVEKIALIPGKEVIAAGKTAGVQLPPTSPLVRGAYKVSPKEEVQFLGGPQTVATSQRGFTPLTPGKTTTLTKELFVSMQEPTLKIPETRISRLGLIDLFRKPERIEVNILGPQQPKIGIERDVFVTKTGVGNTWKSTTQPTGELQAIKIPTITDVQRIGVTTIKGQAVDIFSFRTSPKQAINVFKPKLTTEGATQVSVLTPLGAIFYPKVSYKTTQVKPIIVSPTVTKPTKPVITPSIPPSKPTKPISGPTISYTTPTRILTTLSIPPSKPTTISIPPTITLTPSIPPRITRTPSLPPRVPSYPITPPTRYPTPIPRVPSYPVSGSGLTTGVKVRRKGGGDMFISEVRRFGVWKAVTKPTTYQKAYGLGIKRARETLGVSVRVKRAGQIINIPTPQGFLKGKKEPAIIVEQRRYRLKKFPYRGEVREIQMYRRAAARKQKIINFIKTKRGKNERIKKIKFF